MDADLIKAQMEHEGLYLDDFGYLAEVKPKIEFSEEFYHPKKV